jgi:tetratricopeptide (TPR) repeat protein
MEFASTDSEEEGRYRLHDLARIFAESRLDFLQLADAQYRHSKHYLKVLSEADKLYVKGGMSILPGMKLFDKEWANIKAGQAWAGGLIINARKLKKNVELKNALKLANIYPNSGINVLVLRLHPQDIIQWHETGLVAARMMKDRNEVAHLHNLGIAYADLGEMRRAIEFYELSLSGKRKIKYGEKYEGNTLNGLGNVYLYLGETRKAIEFYKQAMSIASRVKDRKSEGLPICNLAMHTSF